MMLCCNSRTLWLYVLHVSKIGEVQKAGGGGEAESGPVSVAHSFFASVAMIVDRRICRFLNKT